MQCADIGEFEEEVEEVPDFIPDEWVVPSKQEPIPVGA